MHDQSFKKIALVWTEFQANILMSIMNSSGISRFDIVFLRDKIASSTRLSEFADRVVILKDISLSYRNMLLIRSEVATKVIPAIPEVPFDLWLCNYTFPSSRRLMFDKMCKSITLFEEGTGCYVNTGVMNSIYGNRAFISAFLLKISYPDYGGSIRYLPKAKTKGKWGLFSGCFPELDLPERCIDHLDFERTLDSIMCGNREAFTVPPGSAVYVPSPFGDINLLSQEIDYQINRECLLSFIKEYRGTKLILWKPHPRCIMANDIEKAKKLSDLTGIEIRIVKERSNFEEFLFSIRCISSLPVFSTTSSSLFIAKALSHRGLEAVSIKSITQLDCMNSSQLIYDVFKRVGVKLIDSSQGR
ncbi:polysialyltransferase family glycosyltransferase [Geomobilimonas luticola]|uniref:Capsule polysaccharide biosynthesis protein n=1 Tax=Geomobilimonas luticola TaxID=1114878 RepID=A0ABS5SCL9_9BACT|nr:polysialyltransferase family glycosyltransferase [Geomobilimonas luticola]MBT0653115.1 hypothetical protein [Geomobilimonas luticola]